MKKLIKKWNILTEDITESWIREVFDIEDDEEVEYWWVGESIGGVFNFADYWASFDQVLDYYKHNISKEQFFLWYDYCLENQDVNISLAKFILSSKEREEQKKKQLEELKQRVEFAQEEFNKALEQYDSQNRKD